MVATRSRIQPMAVDVMSRNCQVSLFGTAEWQHPEETTWGGKWNRGIIHNRRGEGGAADLCLGGLDAAAGEREEAGEEGIDDLLGGAASAHVGRGGRRAGGRGGQRRGVRDPRCRGGRGSGEMVGGARGSQLEISRKPTQLGGDAEAAPASVCLVPCPALPSPRVQTREMEPLEVVKVLRLDWFVYILFPFFPFGS